jgi:hypothetical protein
MVNFGKISVVDVFHKVVSCLSTSKNRRFSINLVKTRVYRDYFYHTSQIEINSSHLKALIYVTYWENR